MDAEKKQKIETMLRNYNRNLAEYNILKGDIIKKTLQIELCEDNELQTRADIIETLALSPNILNETSHIRTNSTKSKTAYIAENYLRYLRKSPMEIDAIRELLEIHIERFEFLSTELDFIGAVLESLNERELFVTTKFFFERYNLNQTLVLYNREYAVSAIYHRQSIENIKNRIINKVLYLYDKKGPS